MTPLLPPLRLLTVFEVVTRSGSTGNDIGGVPPLPRNTGSKP